MTVFLPVTSIVEKKTVSILCKYNLVIRSHVVSLAIVCAYRIPFVESREPSIATPFNDTENIIMDRKFSLSDSDLDSIDGLKTKFDTLQNHSHFFSSTVSHAQSFPELIADGQPNIVIEESKELEPIFSFDNRLGLAHDLSFLAGLPELCDVTFLVGEDRQPVCGVKAILAARSK